MNNVILATRNASGASWVFAPYLRFSCNNRQMILTMLGVTNNIKSYAYLQNGILGVFVGVWSGIKAGQIHMLLDHCVFPFIDKTVPFKHIDKDQKPWSKAYWPRGYGIFSDNILFIWKWKFQIFIFTPCGYQ